MATFTIPMDNTSPAFSLFVDLEEVTYQMKFRWNDRVGLWFFDLFDNEDNAVLLGKPYQTGVDFLKQEVGVTSPKGTLIALNSNEPFLDADRFAIGGDVVLYYVESENA